MIAAFVSYRAVVTGPRIQREIAQRQFDLNNRQIKLQEETLRSLLASCGPICSGHPIRNGLRHSGYSGGAYGTRS